LRLGVRIGLDEIRADEFLAMTLIDAEFSQLEKDRLPNS
jgi:hypothetical protein